MTPAGPRHHVPAAVLGVAIDRLRVAPPALADRHTAMGDARWVARWYDHLGIGGSRESAA